jgi:hypothetical protein
MTNTEPHQGAVDHVFGEVQVHAGFRITDASELAGGPIEIEFFAEITGRGSRFLFITADRMRYRPGDFSFAATFAGVPLADPFANLPDIGGPGGVIEIAAGRLLRQPLILNEFVRLEAAVDLLEPGASGQLVVACRRPLPLAADEVAALALESDAPIVEVPLALELHRDDARLAALVEQLIAEVRHGPREQRERPLGLLLSLRAPAAVERWHTLVNHPDPLVFERVRQTLWSSGL